MLTRRKLCIHLVNLAVGLRMPGDIQRGGDVSIAREGQSFVAAEPLILDPRPHIRGLPGSFAVAEVILSRRYVKSFRWEKGIRHARETKSAKLLDPRLHGPFRLGLPDFFLSEKALPLLAGG